MKIGKYKIGLKNEPFIIAEMSGNHNQSLTRALKIVDLVAKTGAHAIKLQTYTPSSMTLDSSRPEFKIMDKDNLWKGKKLFDLFKIAQTPWEWHEPIMNRAKQLGLVCFSSPFDNAAVDFLEKLNVPAYKIASFENNHHPLIEKVASTGKPMIISTGMATMKEIVETVKVAKNAGCKDLVLLKCTSTYPAMPTNSNILAIPKLKSVFGCEVGLSDHTLGVGASIAAIAHGATVIEKHFTIKRSDGGVDSVFSMEPAEFKTLVSSAKDAWLSLGKDVIGPTLKEKKSLKFRRSLYAIKDIKKGEKFDTNNITVTRPANGLHPRYFKTMIGKKSKKNIKSGTPIKKNVL